MINQDYYKISEVAKLTGISRQTLIYYDKENILKPAFVDDNSYRYYTIYQIHQIQVINMLKEFGTPLKTIKEYLNKRDNQNLSSLLDHIREQLNEKIDTMQAYISIIDERKNMIKKSSEIKDYSKIYLMEKEAMRIFSSADLTPEEQAGIGHFNKSYEMENKLKDMALVGLNINAMVYKSLLTKDYNNQISKFYVTLASEKKGFETEVVSAGLYAVAYHQGKNQTSTEAYIRLIEYIEKNDLIIDGDAYETNIISFLTEADDEDFLSEICIKVARK